MAGMLSHIVRKRFSRSGEDVATDGLAYLLESNEALRSAMNRFLNGIAPALPSLRFRAQQVEGAIRPDLWGFDGPTPRVFIENKFWAGLTDNQPVAYIDGLAASNQVTVLLVIAPAARQRTLWRELTRRLGEAGVGFVEQASAPGVLRTVSTARGPTLALTSWDRLLTILGFSVADDVGARSDLAQLSALCEASDADAFQPFSSAELTDQRLPAFVIQIAALVQSATELGLEERVLDVDGLRPQSSWDRLGRYVWLEGRHLAGGWFGLHFGYWKAFGTTPMWLVFSGTGFGRAHEVRPLIERWAAEKDKLIVTRDDEVAIGLELPAGEESPAVTRALVEEMRSIGDSLHGLPPRLE